MALVPTVVTPTQAAAASGVATSTTGFSPSAGALVYALFTYMFSTNTTGVTFTVADNHSNTYPAVFTPLNNGGAGATYVGMASFTYGGAPGSTTIKVTASSTGAADCLITPVWFTGQASSQTGAAFASSTNGGTGTTEQILITPTTTGSFILIAGGVAAVNVNSTAISGTTLGASWNDAGVGNSANSGITTSAGTGGVQVNVGFTLSGTSTFGYSIAALEVLPSTGGGPKPPPPSLIAPGWQAPSRLVQRQPPPPAPPAAIVPAGAGLSGSGTISPSGALAGASGMSGSGDLAATAAHHGLHSVSAGLSGSGTLAPSGTNIMPQTAGLSGSGTLSAAETLAALSGSGTLTSGGAFGGYAQGLSGAGTLSLSYILGFFLGLTGSGTLSPYETEQFAILTGSGSFVITGWRIGYVAGLVGIGSLSIPQVAGGLVNGIGASGTPLALPGSSQVAVAPPGSANWQWLGTTGLVTALKYGYVCPGGCDKMSMTIETPAMYRSQLYWPGWQVKIVRGGHDIWHGKLDEPQYQEGTGWNLTAVGSGNLGQDFVAYYAVAWPGSEPDEIINRAIARGLPWVNPGYNSSSVASQFWFGQGADAGSQNVAAFLNLICTRGGLTWYVNAQPGGIYGGDDLQIFALPTTVNRLLVVTTPVARTLNGDINTIIIRYQVSADNTTTNTAATYGYVTAQNAQSVTAHGVMETYIDLSDAGVMSSAVAQGVGNQVLAIYQRATFAGPFQASYGQLLNAGGVPIDPGTDQAGTVMRLILTDYGYGGEVTPQYPVTFITGAYEWDDFAQVATVTPYQSVDESLTGLLGLQNTLLTPISAASTG